MAAVGISVHHRIYSTKVWIKGQLSSIPNRASARNTREFCCPTRARPFWANGSGQIRERF